MALFTAAHKLACCLGKDSFKVWASHRLDSTTRTHTHHTHVKLPGVTTQQLQSVATVTSLHTLHCYMRTLGAQVAGANIHGSRVLHSRR